MTKLFINAASLVLAAAFFGCGSDSTEPSGAPVGSYTPFEWVTTGTSGQTNQLAIGSTLQITLASDGSTTGHLHTAASGGNPAFDADMAGTWTMSGNVVQFHQNADTFVRNMDFILQPIATGAWDLIGDETFPGGRVQLTLRHGEIL